MSNGTRIGPAPVGPLDRFLRWVPLAIAISGLAITFALSDVLVTRERAQLLVRTEAEARHVAAQLRAGLLQAFDPLQRIAAWWLLQDRPLTLEDWETDAQLFVSARAGLKVIAWIEPNGAKSWSIRPGALPDLNPSQLPDPELRRAVNAARRLASVALSQVFQSGGRFVLYACAPIKRQSRVRGYIAGLYDAAELIESVLVGQLPHDYAVAVTSNGRVIHSLKTSPAAVWPQATRTAQLFLPNTTWSAQVTPSQSDLASLRLLVLSFGAVITLLLYVCASIARVSRRREIQLESINNRLQVEIQERSRAEDRIAELNRDLRHRLSDFQTLLEVLPIGIAVADDPECRNIWINRALATMMRVPMGQNISKSAPGAEKLAFKIMRGGVEVPPDELPMQVAARTKEGIADDQLDIVRADGSVISTLSYSAPVFDEAGKVRGVIDACIDITERKRAEEERRMLLDREQGVRREREKYRSLALMAGGIAHDFNNLLTIIIGQTTLAAMDAPLQSASGRAISHSLDAANRAAELVAKLLAYTGQVWYNAKPVDLSSQIEEMRDTIREIAPSWVELRYDLDPGLPPIRAGIPELQQVVRNLVTNAAEALGEQAGLIEVRTSRCTLDPTHLAVMYPDQVLAPGSYVRLEVTDTGCGIPAELAARVFDPFFTTKFVGRGLGLSAVHGIMRAHGGAVRLESSLHHGTRVEVVFPEYSVGRAAQAPKAEVSL